MSDAKKKCAHYRLLRLRSFWGGWSNYFRCQNCSKQFVAEEVGEI